MKTFIKIIMLFLIIMGFMITYDNPSVHAAGNSFYFKLEINSGYNATDTEMSEIEFYYGGSKISLSDLSIVSNSSEYTSLYWSVQKLINGNTQPQSNTVPASYGTDFTGSYPKYVIIKSAKPFDSVKIYNDSQDGYGAKDVVLYSMIANATPTRTDGNWNQFATYTFPASFSNHLFALSGAAPVNPTNLIATSGDGEVTLSWAGVNATGYNVYRSSTVNGALTKIANNIIGTTYNDVTVINGNEYYYLVTAMNAFGEGGDSNKIFAFPQAPANQYTANLIPVMTANNAPSGVASASDEYSAAYKAFDGIKRYSNPQILSSWSTNMTHGWLAYEFPSPKKIARYVIHFGDYPQTTYKGDAPKAWTFEGSNDGQNWTVLDARTSITVWNTGDAKAFTFNNDTAYLKYRINITSNNGSTTADTNLDIHEMEMMEKLIPSTPTPPNAPISLAAEGGNGQVSLVWDAVSGASSYNVKRSLTAGGPYTTIAEDLTSLNFIDSGVTNGTTYFYIVTAVNTDGESDNSNEAEATPSGPALTNRALLVITLVNGLEKEYDLSMSEVEAFIQWYNNRAEGTGSETYAFNKTYNLANFKSRKDYIAFSKIETFEVNEYEVSNQ